MSEKLSSPFRWFGGKGAALAKVPRIETVWRNKKAVELCEQ